MVALVAGVVLALLIGPAPRCTVAAVAAEDGVLQRARAHVCDAFKLLPAFGFGIWLRHLAEAFG